MPLHTTLYYIFFFVLFFLLVVSIQRDSYGKKIPYFAVVVLLISFNGLRYFVGRDYHVYMDGYSNSYSEALMHMEPLWKGLRAILLHFHMHVAIWFLLTAAFIVIFVLRAYRKQSYFFPLALLAFVLVYPLYFETFNTVRQACAQTVILFTFPLFRDKKYWQTLILLLIAFSLHRTAIIMFFFLPLCFVRYSRILVGAILIVGVTILPYLLYAGFKMLVESHLVSNFYITTDSLLPQVGSLSPAILFRLAIAFYFLYRQRELLEKDASLLPYLNALFFATFLNLLAIRVFSIGTATRFSLYFTYTYPILLSNVYWIGKNIDRWAIFVIFFFEITICVKSIYTADSREDRFYLYDTIFFDREQPMSYPGKKKISLLSPLKEKTPTPKRTLLCYLK